uniref:Uncharacterized protein n=1 Tax=Anguilla anguilla TaxID=7936 RepID=A0A0E9UGN2_ANGAN
MLRIVMEKSRKFHHIVVFSICGNLLRMA